ncbi:transposase [Nesterenkonia xinjiangensis]|uniref:Transposase n=1 Tax=Nesterenkonia xinjiangensis TaxID=225327 RepID=A0A7Z0K7P8_9MICC|nr:transposase [Nesterenkonia xinjiangensis]
MPKKCSPEFKDRAVRMVTDHQRAEQSGNWNALVAVSDALGGVSPHTLRNWVEQSRLAAEQTHQGRTDGGAEDQQELARLRRENAELRRANEILKTASTFFAAELDRPTTR